MLDMLCIEGSLFLSAITHQQSLSERVIHNLDGIVLIPGVNQVSICQQHQDAGTAWQFN
jgi:hypothetical protein